MKLMDKTDAAFNKIDQLNTAAFPKDMTVSTLSLKYAFDTGDVFVTEVNDKILAFAIVTFPNRTEPHLWGIGSDPRFRGEGIGSRLLAEVIQFYIGRGYLDLTVRVDNPAQKLYFDHGFRVTQVMKNYYDGFDGLRMRRGL